MSISHNWVCRFIVYVLCSQRQVCLSDTPLCALFSSDQFWLSLMLILFSDWAWEALRSSIALWHLGSFDFALWQMFARAGSLCSTRTNMSVCSQDTSVTFDSRTRTIIRFTVPQAMLADFKYCWIELGSAGCLWCCTALMTFRHQLCTPLPSAAIGNVLFYKASSTFLLTLILDVVSKSLAVGTVRFIESGQHIRKGVTALLATGTWWDSMTVQDFTRWRTCTYPKSRQAELLSSAFASRRRYIEQRSQNQVATTYNCMLLITRSCFYKRHKAMSDPCCGI